MPSKAKALENLRFVNYFIYTLNRILRMKLKLDICFIKSYHGFKLLVKKIKVLLSSKYAIHREWMEKFKMNTASFPFFFAISCNISTMPFEIYDIYDTATVEITVNYTLKKRNSDHNPSVTPSTFSLRLKTCTSAQFLLNGTQKRWRFSFFVFNLNPRVDQSSASLVLTQ